MIPGIDPKQLDRLTRRIIAKGSEINEALTALLAGETVDVDRLMGRGTPGETPIERLRRFLALIDERLLAIRQGRYGRCERCGRAFLFPELDEVPWATECRECAVALAS